MEVSHRGKDWRGECGWSCGWYSIEKGSDYVDYGERSATRPKMVRGEVTGTRRKMIRDSAEIEPL
jgi:hypothetical protein